MHFEKGSLLLVFAVLLAGVQIASGDARKHIVVVTGLQTETEIAKGPGVKVIPTGGSVQSAMRRLESVDPSKVRAVLSFGIAGGLIDLLRLGSVAMATEIRADNGRVYPVSRTLTDTIAIRLKTRDISVLKGPWFANETPTLSAGGKAALHVNSGAIATDTETLAAAIWAHRHRLPFAVLRTISDPVEVSLPPAAYNAIRPDGSYNVEAVLSDILSNPAQLPALLKSASDASIAFSSLRRSRLIANLGKL